ncbi:GNAT family N-acetyltransferase [Brevundimonas fontaquae]|uniref:GNAT family N-acetyltransferase n=1 Tax=Brevundimonas fontaquae TaxID=2813778 RepID=A0ABX7LNL8_9CAUL|nr:GNAT family N-acetyltransferase [Brevundimonas fontaquae]QSF52941.1 GNAT family N-acetyltransferase [Brevundimonas fontaquae]
MTVAIVDFRPDHASAWAQMNTAWLIEGEFAIEAKDRVAINDPQGVFLDKGGRIFIAQSNGQAVGCCAMVPTGDAVEICKMTVTPAARGLGLARRLLDACEAAAREAGAARLYLETNSALKPAIALYDSAGFLHLPPRPTPYARADVFMEKWL